jgi:hypothetical protein
MRNLTLPQALQLNKALPKCNRQSALQIKNWYAQGYYLKANRRWCCIVGYNYGVGPREARKYSTA